MKNFTIAFVGFLVFVFLYLNVRGKITMQEPTFTDKQLEKEMTSKIFLRYLEIHGAPVTDSEVCDMMYIIFNDRDCY